ncbi:hypothetical protein AB3331_02175 [Streptococcus sp. H49]|uniref:hypothetical protein n=1 Tax=Streptococcus huangxiaojuni TaxID=3237239 RepID=UPI0034A36F38
MASDAGGITLTAIFFTRILGRVQFNKIQSPLKGLFYEVQAKSSFAAISKSFLYR